MPRSPRHLIVSAALLVALALAGPMPRAKAGVTREEVERAITSGVRFLLRQQRDDGSWPEIEDDARTGTTSLVTLALLTAGEAPDSLAIRRSLEFLRKFDPGQLDSVYSVSLADDGLRRRHPQGRRRPDPGQRRLARRRPAQAGRPRPLARLVELQGFEDPARRQLELAVRLARPERREPKPG